LKEDPPYPPDLAAWAGSLSGYFVRRVLG